jgi:hypothetical protein
LVMASEKDDDGKRWNFCTREENEKNRKGKAEEKIIYRNIVIILYFLNQAHFLKLVSLF